MAFSLFVCGYELAQNANRSKSVFVYGTNGIIIAHLLLLLFLQSIQKLAVCTAAIWILRTDVLQVIKIHNAIQESFLLYLCECLDRNILCYDSQPGKISISRVYSFQVSNIKMLWTQLKNKMVDIVFVLLLFLIAK